MPRRTEATLTVEGRELAVSNLGKVFYPATGFTKGDVIRYYIDIAPFLLPHLKGRALTLKRYPNGVDGPHFYEKRCPPNRPAWVKTAPIYSDRKKARINYCLANDLPSLVWAANLADLELHIPLGLARRDDRPTFMVFDLDPGPGADVLACAEVALALRERLAALKLESWIKTSGSKGLQLYVPLNTAVTFDETKAASRQLADAVASDLPRLVVTNMLKSLRKGKVLIDWSQNSTHKTTVSVYSLRATKEPGVSTPLKWTELQKLRRAADPAAFRFTPDDVRRRTQRHGDLFAPVLATKQKLPR